LSVTEQHILPSCEIRIPSEMNPAKYSTYQNYMNGKQQIPEHTVFR
jgi:hypothetical protein